MPSLISFVGLDIESSAMNEWPEGVDETEDDAFTWNASSTKDGGSGGERIDSDKLLRDVETVGVLILLSVVAPVMTGVVQYFTHSIL